MGFNIPIFGRFIRNHRSLMKFTAAELANLLGGKVEGDEAVGVSKLAKIEEGEFGAVSFLSNEQYNHFIYTTKASVVIVNQSFTPEQKLPDSLTLIKVEDARMAFAKVLEAYHKYTHNFTGIAASARIDPSATIGENVFVGANAVIGENTVIGDNSKIYANSTVERDVVMGKNCVVKSGVQVLEQTIIGDACIIQPGAIIGGDGFGFAPNPDNNYQKIVHIGNVILEDHVEIGANTTIDRATLGSTIIRKGAKLDNLIQIAHNVEIGENTVIAAQTGVAGSTKIGKNCMIGGQVGIIGHLTIADEVKIAAQSGIGHSIPNKGEIVQGSPAFPIGDYKRSYVMFRKLPKLNEQIGELMRKINAK